MIIKLCISMSGADSKSSSKARIPAGSTPWDSGELRGKAVTLILASLEREDLDTDHGYPVCLSSKSVQIGYVTSENRTVWLGQCDDQRINSRSLPRDAVARPLEWRGSAALNLRLGKYRCCTKYNLDIRCPCERKYLMGPEHQDIQGLTFFVSKERGGDLERLTEFIESGKLTPSIDQIFS
jgi:hypothetical protein